MKKITCLLILFLSMQMVTRAERDYRAFKLPSADTVFLELPAGAYQINEERLPFYSTTHKIGKVPSDLKFHISLDYPEYSVLSRDEVKWAQKHESQLADTVRIRTRLGFSRKDGYLDISFCPIIKKGNQYLRLKSCKLNITPNKKFARVASSPASREQEITPRWKNSSVLSAGKWVKIRVKKEGIYSLTPSFLANMGFDDPSKVKLFGYGGRILEEDWVFGQKGQVVDDLEEIPLYRKADGKMLFFAEGTVRWTFTPKENRWIHENNPYSKYSYYFITEGDNPQKLGTEEFKTASKTVSSIPYYAVLDNDAFGWYSGGREMYDEYDFANGPQHSYKVKAESCTNDSTSTNAAVDISFSAASMFTTTTVSINHGETFLGNISIPKYGSFQSAYEARKSFATKQMQEENKFTFKVSPSNSARLNFIRLNYKRKLKATDTPFSFSPNIKNAVQLNIEGANEHTRVWRIGSYDTPTCEVASSLSGSTLKVNLEDGTQRYVFLNLEGDYPTPEWDKKVENQNLHGDSASYDMVILIPESKKLLAEAERLAEAHRQMQGLRVKVVDAGQIYNEFSSGTPDATAYRRYMKMLYDKASSDKDLPRYLLLFGNCAWDNRMLTNDYRSNTPNDYLLSFEVTDGFNNLNNSVFALGEQNSYVTDDYFGWLDDDEGSNYVTNKVDLGIGRFPCSDEVTAKIFVDKSISYLKNENTGSWKNIIYMLADDGNGNLHMTDTEMVIKEIEESTHSNTVIKKVYNDAYTRVSTGTGHSYPTVTKILQDAMQQGALIFNYTGHGSPDQLSHAKILKIADFEKPSAGNLPLWIMASCEISPYDSKRDDIGRAALENQLGGAVAVMCASRAVYSNYNRILNIAFNRFLFANDSYGKRNTMGDALRLTKVDLVTPSDFGGIQDGSINKLKYVLLGNPALPLTAPTEQVIVDSINGIDIENSKAIQLKAGSLVNFSGHIQNTRGTLLDNFNGSLTATMADRMETIVCKNNDLSADEPMQYQDRTKKIFEGSDSIKNGHFNITFRIPRDISYTDDNGRITFYAVNTEKNLEGHGACEHFYLNGTDNSYAPDTLAPEIHIYLDNPDFPDGGITAATPTFFAKIKDDAGINATGVGIGHDMELVIDKDFSNPISLNNHFNYTFGSYNEGLAIYPLENLEIGAHTLSFRVWDVNGNSSTKELRFFVQEGLQQGFDVYATENPARNQTSFVTTFDAKTEAEAHEAVFEVYNLNGQKVWQSAPLTLAPGCGHGLAAWRLTVGNGGRVPAGVYLYKVTLRSEQNKRESKAKKIIVLEQ